ncbi:hypothetical protein QZH41_017849 [Actinostola sp. cb2023]|nr:hypothetical protein QZH41_017849 [Actinostola sp. cb2023]
MGFLCSNYEFIFTIHMGFLCANYVFIFAIHMAFLCSNYEFIFTIHMGFLCANYVFIFAIHMGFLCSNYEFIFAFHMGFLCSNYEFIFTIHMGFLCSNYEFIFTIHMGFLCSNYEFIFTIHMGFLCANYVFIFAIHMGFLCSYYEFIFTIHMGFLCANYVFIFAIHMGFLCSNYEFIFTIHMGFLCANYVFILLSTWASCVLITYSSAGSPNFFKGYRYVKDNDKTTRLLYDCHGRVAGIQATITPPPSYPTKFNSEPWHKNPDGTISATAYFRDPQHICTCRKHCNKPHVSPKLVGDRLWIQLGDVGRKHFMKLPLHAKDMVTTPWVEGNCFPAMGVHYHYNVSKSFDCNYALPVFLITSAQTGDVHGFGWGVPFKVDNKRWEHPHPSLFARSIKAANIPDCIKNYKSISVQHVYFVNARAISCP